MDVGRTMHDELLHQVDEPQEERLQRTLEAVEKATDRRATKDLKRVAAGEATPLLATSNKHSMVVDMAKLDAELDAQEAKAEQADSVLTDWELICQESWHLVKLSIPITMTAMLDILPDIVLSMMIGHAAAGNSTEVLAAFNLSNLVIIFVTGGWYQGITSATDTLCSQAFGGARLRELWLFCQAGLIVYVACLPVVFGLMFTGTPILEALGQDPSISQLAGTLLLLNSLVVPPCITYGLLKSALQAQNIVSPFVTSSLIGWIVSGTLAYYLTFHTPLGYLGVPLTTPVNWIVKTLVLIPPVLKADTVVSAWPGWQWRSALSLVPAVARLSGSGALMFLFQTLGFMTISLLAGLLPNAAVMITANGIFSSIMSFCFMPLLGVGIGGAIRLGNSLGAGQARRAGLISILIMVASVAVASVATVFIGIMARQYARSFNANEEATDTATTLIYRLLPVIPLTGFSYGLMAIFRACGKQWLGAQFNFVCVFVLGVPLGLLFAMRLDEGIVGLWFGNLAGLVVFAVAGCIWLRRTKWDVMAHEAMYNTHLHVQDVEPAVAA